MPTLKFTDRSIHAGKVVPRDGRIEYRDETLPGFWLRVSASGARVFGVTYRSSGRLVRHTIGQMPPLKLTEAREAAEKLLARVELGDDPQAEKLEARRAVPFGVLCEKFIEDRERRQKLAPKTATEYRRMFKANVAGSPIAHLPAAKLHRADLRGLLEDLAAKAPVQANRLFQFVRAVCRWAVREDYLEANPAEGIQRPREEHSRERVLSDGEVVALWRALDEARPVVAGAVKALLLLGQRTSETVDGMRWEDLRLDDAVPHWAVPGRFRKGGRSHAVPLPPLFVRTLEGLRSVTGRRVRVFDGISKVNSERDWWGAVREKAITNGAAHFTAHDLRRTAATGCARLGASAETVSRILGHRQAAGTLAVTGIYDRYDRLAERGAALNAWAAHVERLLSGQDRRADVLPMVRA